MFLELAASSPWAARTDRCVCSGGPAGGSFAPIDGSPLQASPQSARQAVAAPVSLRGMWRLRLRTAWNCRPVPWCACSPWFDALCHALRLFARLPRASPGDRSSRRLLCARGLLQRVVCCQFSLHTNAKPWTHVFRILQKKGITTNPIGVAFAAARYGAVLGGVGLWMTSAPRFSSTIW